MKRLLSFSLLLAGIFASYSASAHVLTIKFVNEATALPPGISNPRPLLWEPYAAITILGSSQILQKGNTVTLTYDDSGKETLLVPGLLYDTGQAACSNNGKSVVLDTAYGSATVTITGSDWPLQCTCTGNACGLGAKHV